MIEGKMMSMFILVSLFLHFSRRCLCLYDALKNARWKNRSGSWVGIAVQMHHLNSNSDILMKKMSQLQIICDSY